MYVLSSMQRDHRVLARLVAALEGYAESLLKSGARPEGELYRFVRALAALIDLRHGEKEEQVLFPWIVRHGFDFNAEPLEHCLAAHCQERYLIAVLAQFAARGERNWSAEDVRRVVATALALVRSCEQLLSEEALELLPEIVARFDRLALSELDSELCRFAEASDGSEDGREASSVARELMERYALAPSSGDAGRIAPG
jgi:hemerythrin-like domain-containing protein